MTHYCWLNWQLCTWSCKQTRSASSYSWSHPRRLKEFASSLAQTHPLVRSALRLPQSLGSREDQHRRTSSRFHSFEEVASFAYAFFALSSFVSAGEVHQLLVSQLLQQLWFSITQQAQGLLQARRMRYTEWLVAGNTARSTSSSPVWESAESPPQVFHRSIVRRILLNWEIWTS